jgi:hypothetical protein
MLTLNIKLKMKIIVLLVAAVFMQTAVSAQKIKTMQNIEWLTGHWMMEGKKGNTFEEWKIVDDTRMEGKSFKVFKKDTSVRQDLQIVMEGGELYYIATVKDQSNGEPVRFKMTDGNRRHMDFENQEHDFPKQIKYQWKQNDHYEVEISGPLKPGSKKNKVILFSFKKQD